MAVAQPTLCGYHGCVGILPISVRGEFLLATPTFPSALTQCLLHLLGNPTVVYCPVCQHENDILDAVLLLDETQGNCVLYFAERHRDKPKLIERLRDGLVKELGLPHCEIASDPRGFRRAVATTVLHDHMRTLNEAGAAENLFQWFQGNAGRVGLPFMSAMWLLLKGALPVGADPVDPREAQARVISTKSFFLPTVGDTRLFSHVQISRATEHITELVAEILSLRLLEISASLGDPPVINEALEKLRVMCPRQLLQTGVSGRLGQSLADMIALATNQGDDFAKLVGSYTLEALHALLHHVHGTANPRKSEWTRQLALFEAVQPADSRRMGMLLPEATVRDTIDEGLFIQTVASFARSIGLYEPEKEDAIARVIRPVNDLFPSQVRKLFGFRMNLPDETKDKLSDFFDRKFFDRIFAHGDAERVGSALSTALRNALRHPGEMPKICSDAWSSRSATACDLNQKLSCLNLLIEHLNLVRQHDEAIRYARIGDSEIAKDTVGAAPEILASFHNEFGSCYRYLAEYDLALEQYEISFNRTSRSPKVADVRVVLRNIAIVQRSMGQFSTARETLVKLRKDADYLERFGLLLSEAICWQSAGYWDRALSLLESHAAEIQPAAYADQNVRFYAFTLGQLLFHENRFEAALPHLEASLAAARDVNDTFFVALNECLLYRCRSAWSGSSDPAERERIIDALSPLLDGPLSLNTSTNAAVGVAHHVCELLIEDGRDGHAEEVARRLLEIRGEDSHDVWLFHLMAAELADARADWEQASKDLLAALSNLNMSIRRADPQNDPFALLSRRFRNLVRLAALLIKYEKAGLFKPAALWLCADIQTSPVLTSRLTAASAPLSAYSVDAIQGFLGTTTAMMQVIEDNDGMLMLLTTIVDGKPHVAMERLGITSREARSLDARLDYWLRLQRVNQKTLSLDEVRGWAAFQSQLSMIMRDVPAETVLHLAPGGLGMTALHCAFSERPHCFVPSMGSAIAVRARRPPVLWRPKHMFNLSVWRAGDSSYTVEAMQKASKRFEEIGQEYGVATEQAFGIEASAAALIEGLQRSDLARLACHGQVKPLEQTVDLLLAADGLLPPSVVQAYLDRRYDKNHFGWQNLKNLSSVPRMVVSSACDSGYSILNDSGERLGFDRALLRAGTTCYVAPLWPVAVDEIQDLTCSIIERYLEEPEGTIGAAVLAACRDFESHGGGQLTSRSIAVFGDFL